MLFPCATAWPSLTVMPRAAALGELPAQPALARACGGYHADDLAVPRLGLGQRRLERRHVGVPADEARQAAGARDVEARSSRPRADEPVHPQWLAHAFDAEVTEVLQLKIVADQRGGGGRQVAGVG
jgi:hypothetical protein